MATEFSGSGDVRRSLELLWGTQDKPTRGPKPRLTVEQIVDSAISIADTEGLEALSMRRVATNLGVGTMSLYRYVPSKAELLDLMLDHVAAIHEELRTEESVGWRKALERVARGTWELCLAHPWYTHVDQTRVMLGPGNLSSLDVVIRHMHDLPLTDQQKVIMVSSVDGFVTAMARTHLNAVDAERRTGLSEDEFWNVQEPFLVRAMEGGMFPELAQLSEDTFTFEFETIVDFAIDRMLDGVERFVERRD